MNDKNMGMANNGWALYPTSFFIGENTDCMIWLRIYFHISLFVAISIIIILDQYYWASSSLI